MISLLIAAASLPAPPNLAGIFAPDDYPSWALRNQESAAALVEFLVNPDGRVSRCELVASFGSKRLAHDLCGIVLRKRLPRARDAAGTNIHYVVRTTLKMFLPERRDGRLIAALKDAPDVVLEVEHLPGAQFTAETEVKLVVDPTGAVSDCAPVSRNVRQELVKAACSARDRLGAKPVKDKAGQPVRYVTIRKVEFRVAGGTPTNRP